MLPRIRVDGRRFVTEQGQPFAWRGTNGVRAIERVARGQQADVRYFGHGVTVVRVLAMARHLFELPPGLGAQALPEPLALARRAGLYLEVVGLADTATYTFDRRAFISMLGASCDGDGGWCFICHTNEQCALSEEIGKPVVNDEPKREDLAEDKQLAMAAL